MNAPPQHLAALAYGNKVRLKRAEIKRDVKRGKRHARQIIESPPPELARMTVAELLKAQRQWGAERVRKFLQDVEISEKRTLERLTERQRAVLAGALA